MLKFVVVCALLACASAQHHGLAHGQSHGSSDDVHAEIIHLKSDVHEGGFSYGYKTSNNIEAFSEGDEHGNHRGKFGWVSPEGEHINVDFVANEDGYQPQSEALPTPHPIPEAILRSIKYIEQHPPKDFPVHGGHKF